MEDIVYLAMSDCRAGLRRFAPSALAARSKRAGTARISAHGTWEPCLRNVPHVPPTKSMNYSRHMIVRVAASSTASKIPIDAGSATVFIESNSWRGKSTNSLH